MNKKFGVHPMGTSDLSLPKSTRVGRYDLLLPLGRGGMATVYLATTTGFGGFRRDVALKLSHPHLAVESEYLESLLREATIGSRIRHPNVVNIEDVGSVDEGVYLVMEYVDGISLHSLAKKIAAAGETFPLPEALAILIEALAGLHAAHEVLDENGAPLNVVHRDFTPQNILIARDGRVRLTDFGVAKARLGAKETQSGVIKGKLRYMSPEQVQGYAIDRRTDIWAAGVILWELLAGGALFDGKTDETATMFSILMAPIPSIDARRSVPNEVSSAIAQALERDLSARTPSALEMSQRLRGALNAIGVQPNIEALVQKFAQRDLDERAAIVTERRAAAGAAKTENQADDSTTDPSSDKTSSSEVVAREQVQPSAGHPFRTRAIVGTLAFLLTTGIALALLRRTNSTEAPLPVSPVEQAASLVPSAPVSVPTSVDPLPSASVATAQPSSAQAAASTHARPSPHTRPTPSTKSGVPKLTDGVYGKKR